ncbi:MAG: class I tRNA ligase family protein [Candidatus Bathyarchaeota archaeon]|jgi:isoleucyl-tRNA synthetase
MFKNIKSKVDLPKLEQQVLKLWKKIGAFEKRRTLNQKNKRWSFIDGPITANNPMGVHHAWGRTYKDIFQRYKSMQGFRLRYQNGFDCQGLWIEVEVEKDLGFKSKRDIESYGIAEFVKRCKERALNYAAQMVEQSIRLGYWMDWDDPHLLRKLANNLGDQNKVMTVKGPQGDVTATAENLIGMLGTPQLGGSYFTLSNENNYTIWNVLRKCHQRGWIYKGTDVMPWCPRCSTALSQHEIATSGYREITHVGVTLKFPLKERNNEALLVWTTTPWTLTSNVAAAVNPSMIYVKVNYDGESLYLAKATLSRILGKRKHEVIGELSGEELVGLTYAGPFDELSEEQKSKAVELHRVIPWEEVSELEGTGIVHIAPGCGQEDFELGKEFDLPAVAPLNEFGVFVEGFDWLTGVHVYESAQPIIDNLKEKGLLFRTEKYKHRYPICWRCGNELVFRLVDEWFISMGKKFSKPIEQITKQEKEENLRYQIMEVAKKVQWIPSYGEQQELDWLQNMDDWMISKKRFWGLALPIWECTNCGHFEVVGSKQELKSLAIKGWEEFNGHTPHRPWIDKVKIKCPKCGGVVSRILDVGNPWLDAGIVAYSTLNYRCDKSLWKKWFPADLICESLPGQFRNWFYSMLAMSTILERCTPFKTCFGHGLVFDEKGEEMHKSTGNVIWLDEAAEKIGIDIVRWVYCTSKPEKNIFFGYKLAEEANKRFLMTLWNIYSFFITYANLDKWTPKDTTHNYSLLDQWILSKLQLLIQQVTENLEKFDVYNSTILLEEFVDELSKWYLRRSRRRFWKNEADEDKKAGYTTLYTCLTTLTKILAPFLPFTSENMYQNLVRSINTESTESVHHNYWPKADESLKNINLVKDMGMAIKICSLGRSSRNKAGIKLRQPLKEARVVADKKITERLKNLAHLIKEELNVKELIFTDKETELVTYEIIPLPQTLGKKHGPLFPKIQKVIKNMNPEDILANLEKNQSIKIKVDEISVTLNPEEIEIRKQPQKDYVVTEEQEITVGIITSISKELEKEGLAREIVRRIQNQRRDAGFYIADQIEIYYKSGQELSDTINTHNKYIAAETLALKIEKTQPPEKAYIQKHEFRDEIIQIGLVRKEQKPKQSPTKP